MPPSTSPRVTASPGFQDRGPLKMPTVTACTRCVFGDASVAAGAAAPWGGSGGPPRRRPARRGGRGRGPPRPPPPAAAGRCRGPAAPGCLAPGARRGSAAEEFVERAEEPEAVGRGPLLTPCAWL